MSIDKMINMVELILINDEKARDCDFRLECLVYSKAIDLRKTNVFAFYGKLIHKKLPKPSSIRRARRKCQELYPHTRGKKYDTRQESQKGIKEGLNEAKIKSSNPSWY